MKRRIVTVALVLVLLSLIVTYFKEEINNISYGLNNNPIAVMIYDEEQNTYVKKSNIPVGNYRLNEEKSYCTNGGEITHYNWTTGTIKYNLDIGETCYVYFDEDTVPSYAIYSETDNSLIFYKNNDNVGSTYNGRVVTAKYDDIENSIYTYDTSTTTPSTPWYEYASVIKTVSVANELTPISAAMWFTKLQNLESINLTNLNTTYVISMERMFDKAGQNNSNFTIKLGDKFDTSDVTTMFCMFQYTGQNSTIMTLDLGKRFDTSKVTNMKGMFNYTGQSSSVFTLDLGKKFDTSNVTDMMAMFQNFAAVSTNFKLDLGNKFNTSNVTNMANMFTNAGSQSENFQMNLGENFDTSKVTNMYAMFSRAGDNNEEFTLDLGDKFDTSQCVNMSAMFAMTGFNNPNFELDLSNLIVRNDCNLTQLAYKSASKIIFGEGWANATLVSQMFYKDSSTSIEIVNAPANILNYDFASDNRVVTFTTI